VTEEHWTALLDEGGYPLLSVMRRHDSRKGRLLDGEPVVDRRIHAAMDGGQGCGERQGRLAGKLGREAKGGAESSSRETTRFTKPSLAASDASNTRPLRINSVAAFRPTFRGKRWVPSKVGMIPILISAFEKVAQSAAIAMDSSYHVLIAVEALGYDPGVSHGCTTGMAPQGSRCILARQTHSAWELIVF